MKRIKDDREILAETENSKITVREKLSLAHCKNILNRNGKNYTDAEVILIRDFLYAMATIDYLFFTEQYLKKKSIDQKQHDHEEDSDFLHPD